MSRITTTVSEAMYTNYNLYACECRLRFVREDNDTEDVPIYTDSGYTYFMVKCKSCYSLQRQCRLTLSLVCIHILQLTHLPFSAQEQHVKSTVRLGKA